MATAKVYIEMKYWLRLIWAVAVLALFVYLGNRTWQIDGKPVPAIGPFFSPFTGFWQQAEPVVAPLAVVQSLPQLKDSAWVVFDERRVPHIFANNLEDALYLQGYITARDRLWQMDMSMRDAAGRLSEVLGPRTLARDKLQRRRGLHRAAARAVESWKRAPELYALIEAYVRGVNDWITSLRPRDWPLEFKLLGYAPELWSVEKSALFVQSMALTLNYGADDVRASNMRAVWGDSLFQWLYPEWNPKQKPVIPSGTPWPFAPVDTSWQAPQAIGQVFPWRDEPGTPPFVGSNNWAVAPQKTANGYPILCNDPHLRLTLPAIWYELQIHTPQMNVYGASLPALPGVISGFNEHIAWGITNVGQDVRDWYRIHWADSAKTSYFLDGQLKPVAWVVEAIAVKGQGVVYDTVRHTHWGPVVYEDANGRYADLAMYWLSNLPVQPTQLLSFLGLNQGRSLADYRKALAHYDYPAQNFAFAARSGDIAMTVNGKFPLRAPQQGRFVQEGHRSANGWRGFVPRAHLPSVVNPSRGFVASANQHSTDTTYPYYHHGNFDDYRGRYVVRRLSQMDSITVADMMALQTDNYSIFGEEVKWLMLRLIDAETCTPAQRPWLDTVANWNHRFEAHLRAPILVTEWWDRFYHLTWDEVAQYQDQMDVLWPETWRTIALAEQSPTHSFFDRISTSEQETAFDLATIAFQQMLDEIQNQLEEAQTDWAAWKDTEINHLGQISAFGRHHLQVGGFRHALNAMQTHHGPSWRMVVELADTVQAWGIYPGGASGNPGSKWYDHMVDDWVAGKYYRLRFWKRPDEDPSHVTTTWLFLPKGKAMD